MRAKDLLQKLMAGDIPLTATLYVQAADPETGLPVLVAVTGIARGESDTYGNAVIIETED